MRARELAVDYPALPAAEPAARAARLLAEEDVDAVLVESEDRFVGVVTDITLLRWMLPRYLEDDPALARVVEEQAADVLWERLEGHQVGELLSATPWKAAEVTGDDTLIEVAAAMCRTGAPLVAVREQGRITGGITSSTLLTRLLQHP